MSLMPVKCLVLLLSATRFFNNAFRYSLTFSVRHLNSVFVLRVRIFYAMAP
jgi:hypothetical protein